jgi:uncharacterized 2Fe-2S/4Fe-4S cluster protein (DUF4445 family)
MGIAVTFFPARVSVEVPHGTTLLEAAFRAGLYLNSQCGGQGVCGKCLVRLQNGEEVKACRTVVTHPMTVMVSEGALNDSLEKTAAIVEKITYPLAPLARTVTVSLTPPGGSDNRADLQRLIQALHLPGVPVHINPAVLAGLPGTLRRGEWTCMVTLLSHHDHCDIIKVTEAMGRPLLFGVALDIGTTTLAALLINLQDGAILSGKACYNPQMTFGDDVISRIIAASAEEGLHALRKAVIDRVNSLIMLMAGEKGISVDDISAAVYAGNTTMMHLFCGIDPSQIRIDPYVPATRTYPPMATSFSGISMGHSACTVGIPGISSFVGSDIVAGILASGMAESDEVELLMDIGTNGEVVLGCREWMVCCSCSAGPAFEGGGISHGMRATEGAIQWAALGPQSFELRTIGGSPPRGICGSGLIDMIGELFRYRVIDRAGRFTGETLAGPLIKDDGSLHIVVVPAKNTATGKTITLSEHDIAQAIRAKGALYVGTVFLLHKMGLTCADIAKFYIAGGFGTSLNIEKAIFIGLLPDMPIEKFEFLGNSSLAGAKMSLLSTEALKKAHGIAQNVTNFELSLEPSFMNDYTSALFLPHTDLDKFPSVQAFFTAQAGRADYQSP